MNQTPAPVSPSRCPSSLTPSPDPALPTLGPRALWPTVSSCLLAHLPIQDRNWKPILGAPGITQRRDWVINRDKWEADGAGVGVSRG